MSSQQSPLPWFRDRWLRAAIAIGTVLRVLPAAVWYRDSCVRDECTYLRLSERMAEGDGMTSSAGWLWAPGYPALLAIHEFLLGHAATIKGLQVASAAGCAVLMYRIVRDLSGGRRRAALIAAWLYLLSPHLAFFTMRLWSEVLYGTLLMGILLLLRWARSAGPGAKQRLKAGLLLGVMAGGCVLFRGVATYMLPIFIVGLLWTRWRQRGAWGQAAALALGATLTVAPYSVYATQKFDATVVSDRTLGQMMYLGNNDFPPLTFDYGNGQLSKRAFKRYRDRGRLPCAGRKAALERDACQTAAGFEWIREHPTEFVRRMPQRAAQLMTPHSLLTRHLRWGRWKGMPWWMDELIVLWGAASSGLVMIGGSLALMIRGRSHLAVVVGGILLYHVAAIAALAGLSRYRVPLEPLLMLYLALALDDPRGTWRLLRESRWRMLLAGLGMAVIVPLVLWHLPSGWSWWRAW